MTLKDVIKSCDSPLKSQLEVLCDAITLLGKKLEDSQSDFEQAELAMKVIKQDGNVLYRPNPFIAEYRATLRDYHQALGKLQILLQGKVTETQIATLSELRDKFKLG